METINITANGTTWFTVPWAGGDGVFSAEGTFDSGTLKMMIRKDSTRTGHEYDAQNQGSRLTADGDVGFTLIEGMEYGFNLAGAGSPDINVDICRNEQPAWRS